MNRIRRIVAQVASGLAVYRSASFFVWAILAGAAPRPEDLRRLEIDPGAFLSLGHG